MEYYNIFGAGRKRLLMVQKDKLMQFKFKNITSEGSIPVKFKASGSKALAIVGESVMVYKKPNAQQFHYELMKANGIALYRGMSSADSDLLLDNMLDYIETI